MRHACAVPAFACTHAFAAVKGRPRPATYNPTMRIRSTRREFALTLASAPIAVAREDTMENNQSSTRQDGLDPVQWTKERYQLAPLRLTFRATTRPEAELWQTQLRAKVVELLGGFPARIPLQAQAADVREFPGYRRERI